MAKTGEFGEMANFWRNGEIFGEKAKFWRNGKILAKSNKLRLRNNKNV